jgi:hypothetical protein
MQAVFIRFATQDDRVRGFYELATKARIGSFPDEIYQVTFEALELLDEQQIAYRRATDVEVEVAHRRARRPAQTVLSRED